MKVYEALFNRYGPQNWWPGDTPFEVIVGAILTQNTSWRGVEISINNLKPWLEPHILYEMEEAKLRELIKPSGFFNLKAKRLKSFLKFFVNNYGGDIERMKREDTEILRKRLLAVKGIGEETCDSILLYALEKPVFVVDQYTRRIGSRHKLFNEKATYTEIQKIFMQNLPRDTKLYNEFHALIVKLGKDRCKRKNPLCKNCPLNCKCLKKFAKPFQGIS